VYTALDNLLGAGSLRAHLTVARTSPTSEGLPAAGFGLSGSFVAAIRNLRPCSTDADCAGMGYADIVCHDFSTDADGAYEDAVYEGYSDTIRALLVSDASTRASSSTCLNRDASLRSVRALAFGILGGLQVSDLLGNSAPLKVCMPNPTATEASIRANFESWLESLAPKSTRDPSSGTTTYSVPYLADDAEELLPSTLTNPLTPALTTPNPTFAPTPDLTNPPLPTYVESDFDSSTFTVAAVDITSFTPYPTDAPTAAPTAAGYKAVEKAVSKKVVRVELKFAVSAEEAANPVMKAALEEGFANALGLDPTSVRVSSIGGVLVGKPATATGATLRLLYLRDIHHRRLSTDTEIGFEIISNSDAEAQTDALQQNIDTVVTEGAVVANVQKAASDKGVLTQNLKDQERALPKPTLTLGTTTVSVIELVRPTSAPTTKLPVPSETTLEAVEIAGIAICGSLIIVLLVTCFMRKRVGKASAADAQKALKAAGV
jgi:hypothetical protein